MRAHETNLSVASGIIVCMTTHERINAENAAAARAAGWPTITGTEKQVAWAITIRAGKVRELDEAIAQMTMSDVACSLLRCGMLCEVRASEWIGGKEIPWNAWAYLHLSEDERADLAKHP